MHGNLNFVGLFVRHSEQTYYEHYAVKNGCDNYVRPVAMLIIHRWAGLSLHDTARYFGCTTSAAQWAISKQLSLEQVNDPKFVQHYNQLLQLYIDSTRFYIRKRKFLC